MRLERLQKIVELLLPPKRRGWSVAWNDHGVIRQRKQFLANRGEDQPAVAARKVGSADAVAEQRIAGDELLLRGKPQADAAGSVTRRVQNSERRRADSKHIAVSRRGVDL